MNKMLFTPTEQTEPEPRLDSNGLFSSNIPLACEGRVLPPSFQRSRSVTAVAISEKEHHNLEESRSEFEHVEEQRKRNGCVPERCSSLQNLIWREPIMDVLRPNGDNLSVTSAAKSEDRVKELENDLSDARDAIVNLEDSITDLRSRIANLTSQLEKERGKCRTLTEELHVSRKLCMELNGNRLSQDPAEHYSNIHLFEPPSSDSSTSVKEIGVQVSISDNSSTNGAKTPTSPDTQSAHLSTDRQRTATKAKATQACLFTDLNTLFVRERNSHLQPGEISPPMRSTRSAGCECGRKINEELHRLQQQYREKGLKMQKLSEMLAEYIQRNAEMKAEQITIRQNLESMAREKRKLNSHINELNTSLETKQVEIKEQLGELEAKSNLLDVIKQIAYSTPIKNRKTNTPRSVTTTPRNSPAVPSPAGPLQHRDTNLPTGNECSSSTDHEQSYTRSQQDLPIKEVYKGKSSQKMPSKQRRTHASRSLNYNGCANTGNKLPSCQSGSDDNNLGDPGHCGDSDDNDDVQPINNFYNESYVSSSEDIRELGNQRCTDEDMLKQQVLHVTESNDISSQASEDTLLEEAKFQRDFHGDQSSPKEKEEQSVDDLIAEVLAELSEEDTCEADMQAAFAEGVESRSTMESEGLLLRKHELENYAMRARDRSWQYVYVVQHGHQLWFYESKEHQKLGRTYYGEGPLDLTNALVHASADYSKRKHVFRVQLPSGQRFLFQARDDREMLFWLCSMDSATSKNNSTETFMFNGVVPGIGAIPPPQVGSPSKADRLRNMIKGGISALTK